MKSSSITLDPELGEHQLSILHHELNQAYQRYVQMYEVATTQLEEGTYNAKINATCLLLHQINRMVDALAQPVTADDGFTGP